MRKDDAWNFAVTRYGEPGQAQQLLKLQDEQGLDVVLHLFRQYAQERLGRRLDAQALAEAEAALAPWRAQVIAPMRALRRVLKETGRFAPVSGSEAAALRKQLAEAELQAERAQMDALCDWLEARPPASTDRSSGSTAPAS